MLKKRYDLHVGKVKTYEGIGKVRTLDLWVYDSDTGKWEMDVGTIPLYVVWSSVPKGFKTADVGWYVYYKYMKEALYDPKISCFVTLSNGYVTKCLPIKE